MQTLTFAKDSTWQIMVTPDGHYGKLVVDELCVISPKSLSILQTETNPKIGDYQIATYKTLKTLNEKTETITNGKTLDFTVASDNGMLSFTTFTKSLDSNGLSALMLRVAPSIEARVQALETSVTALYKETPYSRKMDKILQDTYALSPKQAAWQAMWLPYTASKFFALGFWTWLNK